jgi:phage repressor protein C with HTH and peptisase S24 domain
VTDASQFSGPNSDLAARLREARAHLDLSQKDMAAAVGVSFRSWQDYEAGKTVPNGREYAKLCALGFRAAWLLGADPPVFDDRRDLAGDVVSRATALDGEVIALPRFDVGAAAGSGISVLGETVSEWIYFRREWLRRELGVNPSRLAIITARGESMSPTIRDGDLLIVDTSEKRWTRDGIYVIGVEDDLWVKRVDRRADGALVLSSDNSEHRHGVETIAKAHVSTIRFVGRVVWSGGKR